MTTKGLLRGYSSLPQGWAGAGVGAEQEVLADDDFLLQELFLRVNQGQRCIQRTYPGVAWLEPSSPTFKCFQGLSLCLEGATTGAPEQRDEAHQLLLLLVCVTALVLVFPFSVVRFWELGPSLCSLSC